MFPAFATRNVVDSIHQIVLRLTLFSILTRRHQSYTLFPSTTLFRSLPPSPRRRRSWKTRRRSSSRWRPTRGGPGGSSPPTSPRSEEHTSELQSRLHLVCRLLLEKKKQDRMNDEPAGTT